MEAARSECEGDGASDEEALFASEEEAKPLNILAAGTGLDKKCRWLAQNVTPPIQRMEATKVYKK
ncbi:hypothetical protein [Bacillus sp. AFS054943]|uniref:hypothetical protein n=1 Tax=unclassified Bacillus (in: firmicutes) TaxID=185979 RepID=UPI00159BBF72|nr:hypothetical protein [Bacillus sp. AFS054943]